jgi:hypothetical protein
LTQDPAALSVARPGFYMDGAPSQTLRLQCPDIGALLRLGQMQGGATVRYRFSALVIATFAFAAPACFTPALAQDATGEWLVKDRTAKIRVINCGNALWGVVSW